MKIEIDLPWSEVERLIDEWIWSETARSMLKTKLYNADVTFEMLAEMNNLSVQRTKKIFYKAEDKLFSKIPPEFLR